MGLQKSIINKRIRMDGWPEMLFAIDHPDGESGPITCIISPVVRA